ncbi:MAG: hypothetical protein WD294_06495 [Phycisphaeraceae bacterium]
MKRLLSLSLVIAAITVGACAKAGAQSQPVEVADRWQLFISDRLVQQATGDAQLRLHHPVDQGNVLTLDKPWEGAFSIYGTVIKDGDTYHMYYRGMPGLSVDDEPTEVTAYATSDDGIHWVKPDLRLHEINGSLENNAILVGTKHTPATQNFSPFLDTREGVPADERFKAVAGNSDSGVLAFVSGDGIHWRPLQEEPVYLQAGNAQKAAFWSEAEQRYVMFFRIEIEGVRSIAKATSEDFLNWTDATPMRFSDTGSTLPSEELYLNQTSPYYRNPHLYIATTARLVEDRQVLSEQKAEQLGALPALITSTSDPVLMTTEAGSNSYDRTFRESFIRPEIGLANWVSRSNFPALNIVPTGEHEMSIYVSQHYGQSTNYVRRYTLRVDGFASVHAGAEGGEVLTPAVVFQGDELLLNFATSAAGSVKVELQDESGAPIEGFTLAECKEQIGNEVERVVSWNGGADVSELAGRPVRLRLVIKDADVYSFRFRAAE